ncbi:CaiB/BaiF CoA transferase family protein [Poriferisphaera sp. WC338]|uniref:CaiB/BaiF CoA transferase family protein n=1 Tax=Poriferisphaera sp. WC338 TaxID=3425129 RepID=UPI003D818E1E
MNRPLDGIIVADFTHVMAGPYCTKYLVESGARVIKIERPVLGDDGRHYGPYDGKNSLYFHTYNHSKESVVLDLKNPDDHKIASNIIAKADILVENFRPGVMKKINFDYDALKSNNPKLIYTSICGYGQTGCMAHLPAYDLIIQAATGLMSVTGEADGPPIKVGPSIADLIAGLYAFTAINTALYHRTRTGKGTHIDIAMFDCLLTLLGVTCLTQTALNITPTRIGNHHSDITPFGIFNCKDTHIIICAGTDALFRQTCEVLNISKLADDPKMATNELRAQNRDYMNHAFNQALSKNTAKHWHEKFDNTGIPSGLVNSIKEALKMPNLKDRDIMIQAGKYTMVGNPMKFSDIEMPKKYATAPTLGQHTNQIRKEFS